VTDTSPSGISSGSVFLWRFEGRAVAGAAEQTLLAAATPDGRPNVRPDSPFEFQLMVHTDMGPGGVRRGVRFGPPQPGAQNASSCRAMQRSATADLAPRTGRSLATICMFDNRAIALGRSLQILTDRIWRTGPVASRAKSSYPCDLMAYPQSGLTEDVKLVHLAKPVKPTTRSRRDNLRIEDNVMTESLRPDLLRQVWEYPLFDALYGRRSRRFGLGFEMVEGPTPYKSQHVVYLIDKTTSPALKMQTAVTPDDRKTVLDLYRESRRELQPGRLGIPRRVPPLCGHNLWDSNMPGSALFMPVCDVSLSLIAPSAIRGSPSWRVPGRGQRPHTVSTGAPSLLYRVHRAGSHLPQHVPCNGSYGPRRLDALRIPVAGNL